MRKNTLILLLSGLIHFASFAQPIGNEWIDYSKPYYKVVVHEDGIYRIPYSAIVAAGIPVATIVDPRYFQLFCNGEEQYIYYAGGEDNIINAGDYLEFFGKKNDGWMDAQLFDSPSSQVNPNYSLFSDSAVYFLTWNSSVNNRRMIVENDVNFSSYTQETFFWRIVRQDYTSTYFNGAPGQGGASDPGYTNGEGWFDGGFSLGGSINKSISTPNRYLFGGNAIVNFTIIGASNYSMLNNDHHVRVQFANQTLDTIFEGYKVLPLNIQVPVADLGTNITPFVFASIDDIGTGADRNTISHTQIKYPHNTNLENSAEFKFVVGNGLQAKYYYGFNGFAALAGDTAHVYDLTTHRRIKVEFDGSNFKVLIPKIGSEQECFISSESQARIVQSLIPAGTGGYFTDYLALATANQTDYLIISHKELWASAVAYRNYRLNTGYNAQIIDVDDLYDQYCYGILKNPLGIRNFIRYAWDNFPEQPKHLFLIGKAYRAGADGAYPCYRNSQTYWDGTLVPSLGNPPSDVLFSAGIADSMYFPALATGRLSARTPDQVDLYLDKVMEYETAQLTPQEWMKNILHFCGGANVAQANSLEMYLNSYRDIIQDTFYGGFVKTFKKTSTVPMQTNESDSLKAIINNGVSLMTFFGHAAGIGFDVGIDNPEEYNNQGKYPFMLALSCYAGDIFIDGTSSSEEFVLIADKGVIAYLASVSLGFPPQLNLYASEWYKNIGYKNYGKTVGECIQQTIKYIQTNDFLIRETCLSMTLHGDPAIILNSFEKPDYTINPSSVYFDPLNVTTEIDSFDVHVISTNIGRAVAGTMIVHILRTFPDGSKTDTSMALVGATYFKDTISFRFPVDVVYGVGMNRFTVTLDYFNGIDEISELNNTTEVQLLIKSTDIVPIWPYKYAVIPELPVTLMASTGYAFLPAMDYIFELDTTDAFNSPVKTSQVVNHSGGVVSWTPIFPIMTDSIVYYWRVSIDSAGFGTNWRESSFQYINGKRGWGQAHFFQFKNDDYQYVRYDKPGRRWIFVNDIKSIFAQTGYYPYVDWLEEYYKINSQNMYIWAYLGPSGNGMIVSAINPVNGVPMLNTNTPGDDQYGWEFSSNDSTSRNEMRKFISDSIPVGYWVLAYSHRNHNAEQYEEGVYQAFESFGSGNIRFIQNDRPYAIFGKKGAVIGNANEITGASISSIIQLKDSITTQWNEGYILSELIGPATSWGSLHWRTYSYEGAATDSVRLSVIGIRSDGTIDTVISSLPKDSADIYNLQTRIDATEFPYLKLIAFTRDDSLHTPNQMNRWQVLYEGVPETALDPSLHYYFYKDSVQEGDDIFFTTATHNISVYDMDSLLISYWIVDRNRNIHPLGSFRQRPHPADDVLKDTITANTAGLQGLNSLWIEVNPANDQLEQYHFNNISEIYFYVDGDDVNPLLDVTFDGIHILDGDIVSAKPEIQITLKDENRFLALNDTACFRVWLKKPNSQTQERIYFVKGGMEIMRWTPAVLPNNSCRIEFPAEFIEDGIYNLTVEAKDISKNLSGDFDYSISFEVINKPSITHIMNWPNPFTTATHFVFTLTGSEIPTFLKIQIMTITGKIVREIDISELGDVHIGRNITDYAWNGTDEFGDRLANGVYLYRVITRLNGNPMELKPTGADEYFTKEFGKMYLMR